MDPGSWKKLHLVLIVGASPNTVLEADRPLVTYLPSYLSNLTMNGLKMPKIAHTYAARMGCLLSFVDDIEELVGYTPDAAFLGTVPPSYRQGRFIFIKY